MKLEKVFFKSEHCNIAGVLHLPSHTERPPCVVASHGLLSSKESEKYISLGHRMAEEGMALLRFDFRGIGESEGGEEDQTISKKLIDLGSALQFVRSYLGPNIRVGLVGSSLGGFLSLIQASKEKAIEALVVWATPLQLKDLETKKQKEDYPLPPRAFFEDLPNHCLLPLLPKVSRCLVIHGEEDELVPPEEPWEIFRHLGLPKELHVIGGADHRLFQPDHRRRAIELTVDWFKKFLF
ncbi:MAG: alpha/beta hydrolase [Desulfobacterota bacterium]|nr:alpha/beta hydrolase [Thermodesulfobacteriota bacterium]